MSCSFCDSNFIVLFLFPGTQQVCSKCWNEQMKTLCLACTCFISLVRLDHFHQMMTTSLISLCFTCMDLQRAWLSSSVAAVVHDTSSGSNLWPSKHHFLVVLVTVLMGLSVPTISPWEFWKLLLFLVFTICFIVHMANHIILFINFFINEKLFQWWWWHLYCFLRQPCFISPLITEKYLHGKIENV